MELGVNPALFTPTVSVIGAPGSTMPLDGVTVIHGALVGTAVNGTGPPVVVSVKVCVAGGLGGVLKLMLVALKPNVAMGPSTVSVTGMLSVLANPTAEN